METESDKKLIGDKIGSLMLVIFKKDLFKNKNIYVFFIRSTGEIIIRSSDREKYVFIYFFSFYMKAYFIQLKKKD